MAVDYEIADPHALADFIEKHLQPGNDPRVMWFEPQLSPAEWTMILAALRSQPKALV